MAGDEAALDDDDDEAEVDEGTDASVLACLPFLGVLERESDASDDRWNNALDNDDDGMVVVLVLVVVLVVLKGEKG